MTEFNSQNLKVKETHYNSDGKIDEVSIYEYDAKGNRHSENDNGCRRQIKDEKKIYL